jgi:glycosyltransferase involved in cell wall biosynthesis
VAATVQLPAPPVELRPRGRAARVAYVLPDLAIGGGQITVLRALRYLDRDAYEPVLFTLTDDPTDLLDAFAAAGLVRQSLDHRGKRAITVARLARELRRHEIDLVHTHTPDDPRISIPAAYVARVPLIAHLHSEWNHRGPHYRNEPDPSIVDVVHGEITAFVRDGIEDRAVDEYLADSVSVADAFRTRVHRPVHAMLQSVPFDEMANAGARHDRARYRREFGLRDGPVVVNVSRHVAGKGQETLLRVMPQVLAAVPDAQVLLVGDGELRPRNEHLARSLGIDESVRFLGNRHDVPDVLAGADVFAFASSTESFGLVVAEAMAARLPVVAYQLPSLMEFSREGLTGRYPDQGDEVGFASALVDVLRNPVEGRSAGRAGWAAVAARYHPRATAESFTAAYERVLHARRHAAG